MSNFNHIRFKKKKKKTCQRSTNVKNIEMKLLENTAVSVSKPVKAHCSS